MNAGSNYSVTVRASAILTGSYVPSTSISSTDANQLLFDVGVVNGSLTSVSMKVEFSNDGITWFSDAYSNNASGTTSSTEWQVPALERVYTLTTGNYAIPVPAYRSPNVRASFRGNGTPTSSSLSCVVRLSSI